MCILTSAVHTTILIHFWLIDSSPVLLRASAFASDQSTSLRLLPARSRALSVSSLRIGMASLALNPKPSPGVLTQFAIVIGIMITQTMGLNLAAPTTWRLVLLFSAALSLVQLLLGTMIVESPVWLSRHGSLRDKDASARRLWKSTPALRGSDSAFRVGVHITSCMLMNCITPAVNEDVEDPLLGVDDEHDRHDAQPLAVNVPTVLFRAEFRKPLAIVCFSMLCQQLSGELCL